MSEIIGEDLFDSRDVIERIEELSTTEIGTWATPDLDASVYYTGEDYRVEWSPYQPDEFFYTYEEACAWLEAEGFEDFSDGSGLTEDDMTELKALAEFAEVADEVPDWEYGATFIHDSYFTDYARDLVTDSGYVSDDLPGWIEIDWDATAENIRADYTSYELDGETYWARA